MQKIPSCERHKRPLQMFCLQCKLLACSKCLPDHTACGLPVDLLDHAGEKMLPEYKTRIEELDAAANVTDRSIEEAFVDSRSLKEGLSKLRSILGDVLGTIDKTIGLFDAMEFAAVPTKSDIRKRIVLQFEELKAAVEAENLSYLADRVSYTPSIAGLGEGEKRLLETLSTIIFRCIGLKEFTTLTTLLTNFNARLELLAPSYISNVKGNFIYGVCSKIESHQKLCKFDIRANKLTPVISVPQHCSVLQTGLRIFVSGGSRPVVNTLYEFAEGSTTLISRASMNYAKHGHSSQAINSRVFASIGGENKGSIPYCEEYLIAEDKWQLLPTLNKSRAYFATTLLNNKFLYAIGKPHERNEIEVLNYNEKRVWMRLEVESEVMFTSSPAAIGLSNSEVLILCGLSSPTVGMLSGGKVKKCAALKAPDFFFNNAVCVVGRKAYLFGSLGNLHVYDMDNRTADVHLYPKIIS